MHIFSQAASVLSAALVFSNVAIAALMNRTAQTLTKRHDWEECQKIKITGRDTGNIHLALTKSSHPYQPSPIFFTLRAFVPLC